jgi:signal transduction histidine kinase
VSVREEGPVVEVCVADDGVGFDPEAVLFESGIAAMRAFAVLGQGSLRVDSRPGGGTRVVARLGDAPAPRDCEPTVESVPLVREPLPAARGLRLVHSRPSIGEA